MTENTDKNLLAIYESKNSLTPVTSGLQQAQLEKCSDRVRQFLSVTVQQEEAIKAVAKILLGVMKTVEAKGETKLTGEVWKGSLNFHPLFGDFVLDMTMNPRWNRQWGQSSAAHWGLLSVKCCKTHPDYKTDTMLQFSINLYCWNPSRPDLSEKGFEAPIYFKVGEHMTSGAVFKVVSRVYEIYAMMSKSETESLTTKS